MSSFLGGVGDIWSTGAFSFESPLKDLLDTKNYTVEQLLAEDELLQELRGLHPELLAFFSTPTAVTKLLQYVILPPDVSMQPLENPLSYAKQSSPKSKQPENDPYLRHVRFPYMACEVICCEIPALLQVLREGEVESPDLMVEPIVTDLKVEMVHSKPTTLLDLLFSVLINTKEGSLDDYRAGYLDKILRVLFKTYPAEMSDYLNANVDTFLPAMLKHVYSHSILQVAQRLLLPQRPVPKKIEPAPPPLMSDEAEITPAADDDSDEEQGKGEIKSEWSQNPNVLEILLSTLTGPEDYENAVVESEELQERRLHASLNASEILITMIQNSLLSSKLMLTLTEASVLERLIRAATTVRPNDDYFSPHESLLTSSMSVLESIILQLGGYGAIGTMSILPEDGVDTSTESAAVEDNDHLIADLSGLLDVLPWLLECISYLLQHPSTAEWKIPTQYSKEVPQPMLGCSRLRIVRLIESLVLLGDPEVDQRLVQSDCLEICLKLFWRFQWCSMLHQSVANLLVHVFEGRNARVDVQEYFLIRCNIIVPLMDSFTEVQDHARVSSNVVLNMNDVSVPDVAVVHDGDKSGTDNDPLPISDDDVEAALEKQEDDEKNHEIEQVSTEAVQFESRDASVVGTGAPPQSFRYGYMGHVIIICQALVHATTPEADEEEQKQGLPLSSSLEDALRSEDGEPKGNESETQEMASADFSKEPLFLAEMVACHPLYDKWQEFVATTLATETATQSAPLGGFNASAFAGDPLHSHRPGLADEGDPLGLESPLPPRGMLGGGDVIDMDDNDLDIAASMMAGLSLRRSPTGDDDSGNSGDSDHSYNSGGEAGTGGYLFDDPLGKVNGGLGIELGQLTKLNSAGASNQLALADDSSDSSDHSSASSSDEGPGRRESDSDVPVLDLFAGNFDYGEEVAPSSWSGSDEAPPPNWSNFANFEDAFESSAAAAAPSPVDDDFGPFAEAKDSPTGEGVFVTKGSSISSEIDEIFGAGDHAELLEATSSAEVEHESLTPAVSEGTAGESVETPEGLDVKGGTPDTVQEEAGAPTPAKDDPVFDNPANDPSSMDYDDLIAAPSDELTADAKEKLPVAIANEAPSENGSREEPTSPA